jgi:hypothetical protein
VIVRYLLPLSVEARPASGIGVTNAIVNGAVISTADAENPDVYVCWGPVNAGTNSLADWAHADYLGANWGAGQAFEARLEGLLSGSGYVFRCFASNSTGTAWSDVQSFAAGVACYVAPTNNGTTDGLGWPTAHTNIQTALDQAGLGDVIYIKGGTYFLTNQLTWTQSGVAILGAYEGTNESGPGECSDVNWPTILARPGTWTNRLMLVSGVRGGTLSRLSLVNGQVRATTTALGGCLLVSGASDVVFSSLTVTGGYLFATYPLVAGSGVCFVNSTNVVLADSTIRDNDGLCADARFTSSLRGSGVYASNTTVTISNCIIRNNGGGNYVATGADTGIAGGGLSVKNGRAIVVDTTIAGNYSRGHYGYNAFRGGGVYVDGGTNVFRNCLIAGNNLRINSPDPSLASGDGVYHAAGASVFANCTVVRNNGQGLSFGGGAVTVTNCILWDNLDDAAGFPTNSAGTLTNVWMSCIEDGDNDGTNGCLAANPRFERGLYLATNSPCVNAGGGTAAGAGLGGRTTRADGTADAGTVDLGFHFQSGIENTPWGELYVDPSGSDANSGADPGSALRSITKALTLATHGSRLHLASGLYTNKVETFPLTINSLYGLELLGTNAETTVIKATGAGQAVLSLRGAGYVRLEGLGVTGGSGSAVYLSGAGVNALASRLTIASCIISNNIPGAPAQGAGIWVKDTFLLMTNSQVTRNSMSVPGGSVPWGHGGGIFVQGGELTLLDSSVTSNTAASRGLSRGGGLFLGSNYGANRHVVSNCLVLGNMASSIGGAAQGGGLFIMATAVVANCVIATNAASTNGINTGGGVFVETGSMALRIESVSGAGDVALRSDTIAGNWPEGVRLNATNGFLAISNSILWNNGDDLFSSNTTATLSNLWYCDIGNGDNAGTNGCFSADPIFVNATNDWHLQSRGGRWTPGDVWIRDPVTSPCVDAGDPAADYARELEPNGRRINLGAYGNTARASKTPLMTGSVISIR